MGILSRIVVRSDPLPFQETMGYFPLLSTDPTNPTMTTDLRLHYERHPYPHFSLLASVRPCDTYALNAEALWAAANGTLPRGQMEILLAGCGSFSPYPTSIANPRAKITALDLSGTNLRRAKLHARLHGCRNIVYQQGDLLDGGCAPGPFSFIDAFGVLHHLPDPGAGLRALERRLAPGGVIRMMVYSRGARREAESIRRALRFLHVRDVETLKAMIARATPTSRLRRFLDDTPEAEFDSGLADMLLHPRVTTYRVSDLLTMIYQAGMAPLRFAHPGAVADVREETDRLCRLEKAGELDVNFVAYLTRGGTTRTGDIAESALMLNPSLRDSVRFLRLGTPQVAPKLGMSNPPLTRAARQFLRSFLTPRPYSSLSEAERRAADRFIDALFLVPLPGASP